MEINRRLNLVVPIERADGVKVFVHAQPIGRDVFREHFLLLGKAHAAIFGGGFSITTGPSLAALMLQHEARGMGLDAQGRALAAEMKRLATVIAPGPRGWETLLFDAAISRGMLSEEDAEEAEGALAFFTVVSAVMHRKQVPAILATAGGLWNWQTTLSGGSEFIASLPTSTPDASSGAPADSLVPS